jgi:hypothetical protein
MKKSVVPIIAAFICLVCSSLITYKVFAQGCSWHSYSCPHGYYQADSDQCTGPKGTNTLCCCPSLEAGDIRNPTTLQNLGQLITKISGVSTPLAVIGFIFSVIYAGFIRMTAAGNPEKEAKSMKIAIAAAVGFAIIALAPLAVRVLGSLLNVEQELIT